MSLPPQDPPPKYFVRKKSRTKVKDKDPIPYPSINDETYHFLTLGFNVTFALQLDREPNSRVKPSQHVGYTAIDETKAMSDDIDISIPGIVAELPNGFGFILIDGNHRAYKANELRRRILPMSSPLSW